MKLISCYIENFGLLHTTDYHFTKDLNCFLSENGTGKTTLTSFIEAMLYGIGEGRKQALDDNPRKKYYPWQGGKFGGSLTLEVGKRKYTIERSFGQRPADDTFRLIDADSGRVSEDYGTDIGEKLFGIDRDGFLRTAFLSEKNLGVKNENKSISAKLSDLVGVDGDVGEFDEAIKLLEERRKFYSKRGNTGEIANVKEMINECQRKIDALTALERVTAEKETALKKLREEKSELEGLVKGTRAKLDTLSRQRERQGHEEVYSTMLTTLENDKKSFEKVKEFFAAGLPTAQDIDDARDAQSEAERLKLEALTERGNEEYLALEEFFKGGTDFSEIERAERSAELREEREKEIASIDNGSDEYSKRMHELFGGTPPTKEAIAQKKKAETRAFVKMAICAVASMIMTVGILLGGMYFITIGLAGFIVSTATAISMLGGKKSKEELTFGDKYGKKAGNLSSIEKKLDLYEQIKSEREDIRARASEEYSRLTLEICDFLGKFPVVDADSMLESVRTIKRKYNQYYAFKSVNEGTASDKLEKLRKSEILAIAAREFLAKYPTKTQNPFSEIREKLISYNQLRSSIMKLEAECDAYAAKHGVTGTLTAGEHEDESALRSQLAELTDRINDLVAGISAGERDITLARAELDRKDEYEMAKEEYEELHRKHVDSLDVIKKTSSYLTEACDNITAKYLGKTKERFEEYSRLIAGMEGDYTLNTSFELMRTERGELHGIDSYSRGIRDLYSLGLRLALIDALYENEAPFIILDDPFIAFDDEKLARAKSTLKAIAKTKQILYFTCSASREIK